MLLLFFHIRNNNNNNNEKKCENTNRTKFIDFPSSHYLGSIKIFQTSICKHRFFGGFLEHDYQFFFQSQLLQLGIAALHFCFIWRYNVGQNATVVFKVCFPHAVAFSNVMKTHKCCDSILFLGVLDWTIVFYWSIQM
jgi:hypothetical protein